MGRGLFVRARRERDIRDLRERGFVAGTTRGRAILDEPRAGRRIGRGKDDTLFAKISGRIKFMDRGSMGKYVMVEPIEAK